MKERSSRELRSRSRSKSQSRSRSRSRTPPRKRSRSPRRRSPGGGGRGRGGGYNRENPAPSKCLGVFNLSTYTTERDLKSIFGQYGEIDRVELVYDRPSGRSRGFGFVYFFDVKDATYARDKMIDSEIDGQRIRVDFSLTKRAHSPTPGQYMGPGGGGGRHGGGGSYGRRPKTSRRDSYRDGYSSRRRSISPRRSPRRRSRSRSYE